MHIWLINPYGALPGEAWREYRTVLAGRALIAAGHTATWWVASFEHRSKSFRVSSWDTRSLLPGFNAIIVPTSGYRRHISLDRIRFERTFARNVRRGAHRAPHPDVIVLSEPALFTSRSVLRLARELRVPLVLDIIDLWPELFQLALPRWLRSYSGYLFAPFFRRRAALFHQAAAYIGVSADYLALAQSVSPHEVAVVCYWGADIEKIRSEMRQDVLLPPAVSSRTKSSEEVWAIYAGTLGPSYDINTIISAAEGLQRDGAKITILIAGDGVSRDEIQSAIAERKLSNCIFLGLLDAAALSALYRKCDVALCTYVAASTVSMPIKAFDYFAAGLPIVNSLARDLGDLVRTRQLGVQYVAEDPVSLAKALIRLAANAGQRTLFARNATQLASEFDWHLQYQAYVTVIETVAMTKEAASDRTI